MGTLRSVVVATPDPAGLTDLLAALDAGDRPFEINVVQADSPSPAMSLCVQSEDLDGDVARCRSAGYAEIWRADGRAGQQFVMTAESGGASILLVAE